MLRGLTNLLSFTLLQTRVYRPYMLTYLRSYKIYIHSRFVLVNSRFNSVFYFLKHLQLRFALHDSHEEFFASGFVDFASEEGESVFDDSWRVFVFRHGLYDSPSVFLGLFLEGFILALSIRFFNNSSTALI